MERNWYVICTKQQQEKKVTEQLAKKGFESYCPFTHFKKQNGTRTLTAHLPLFRSYVFVCITRDEIQSVKKIPNVISTVYWKSEPVTIKAEEINAIKLVVENYMNIELERAPVNINEQVRIVEDNITGYKNNVLSIKPKSLFITLPSLGYKVIAHRANVNRDITEKKTSMVGSIAKKLNPAFLFGF